MLNAEGKNDSRKKLNFLSRLGGTNLEKTTRKISCSLDVSKKDKEAIVALYDALVPKKEIELIELNEVLKVFPSFGNIDVDMIISEAFPRFEATIGEQNFNKVKKHFGIGGKTKRSLSNSKEIDALISNLRTIENAQYYICGYKDLIRKVARLLDGGEKNTELEKAKIVRMFVVLYFGYYYFAEDFSYFGTGESKKVDINYAKIEKNNKMGFYPEELFIMYLSKFSKTPEKSIFSDVIELELLDIKEKKLLKEILEFAELNIENEKLISINKANPYQSFGKVRYIKQRIHSRPGVYPMELFSMKNIAEKLDLGCFYIIYKILKTSNLSELKEVEKPFIKFEGSRMIESKKMCYQVISEICIDGELEKERYIRLVELFAGKRLTMYLRYSVETGEELEKAKPYDMGQFLSAIKFVNEAGLVETTNPERDFEIADKLIKMDKKDVLYKYSFGEFSIDEVKSKLKIDETFEFEFFGIKPKINHREVVLNFALKNGYVNSKDEIDYALIDNLFISENEELIEKYTSGEVDEENFKREIGFSSEFSEMFFSLSKVDISLIEKKLLEVKRSTVGKKKFNKDLKMIVLLYCYIVEGQIPCGPKNRVHKRNKALKTSILKTLI